MSERPSNFLSDDNNRKIQESSLKRIFRSTKALFRQLEENAADIAADDMENPSVFDSILKNKTKTLQIFLAGTLVGAVSVFAVTAHTNTVSDDMTTQLIQERAAEEPTLTPIAEIDIPGIETGEETAQEAEAAPLVPDILDKFTIKPRESLSAVLNKGGLTNREIYLVTEALSDVLNLKQLQVGDEVEIGRMNTDTEEKQLLLVTVEDRRGNRYTAARSDEANLFEASMVEPEVDLKLEYAEGTIDGAFVNNAKSSGIPTNVTQQIIWAFDGPVDFSRDLRKGDTFTAVFHKEYNKSGNPTGNGTLLYATLNVQKKAHERYLYKDSQGHEDYYDETGRIARKLFTVHPLKNPRQTSKFGQRKHPILGYTTMHWGADFGAPIGTPVRAPGEGTITQSGRRGSYGKYVQIKHNSEYSTAYAHMSRIDDKVYVGKKVKAGDIIGYVGNSGRSTGPHLHWELIKSGKKINPVTQRITAQKKLAGTELERFYAERNKMRMNLENETAIAKAEAQPEDRKMAYQGPAKKKKTAVKSRKTRVNTAARKTGKNNG